MMNKKIVSLIFLLAAVSTLMMGCASNKLSPDYDEDEVKAKAEEVVAFANANDYNSIFALFPEDLQTQISAADFETAWSPTLSKYGEFSKYSKEVVVGQTVKETNEELAVAVIIADYADGKAQFTLSFNKDLALVGAYMK